MMVQIDDYVRRGQRWLRQWAGDPKIRQTARYCAWALGGLMLSAASLGNFPQPLVLALLCSGISGLPSALFALGGGCGYLLFWGSAGFQPLVWTAVGLAFALVLSPEKLLRESFLLSAALAGLIVSGCGVAFQMLLGDEPPILIYILRVAIAIGATLLFRAAGKQRDPVTDWMLGSVIILALAQIAPFSFLNLGCIGAGYLALTAPFPGVALAGLALDLSGITPAPMTAALCLAFMLRLIPGLSKSVRCCMPAIAYGLLMYFGSSMDIHPLPGLLLGGITALLVPGKMAAAPRRGETGAAQVRLELAANVLAQSEQLLIEVNEPPIDEQTLLLKAAERACGTCPCRKGCQDREALQHLPVQLLHRPLNNPQDTGSPCRKSGRLLLELRRSQEQLRTIQADRRHRHEHRWALIQQYRFLSEYLQEMSDTLARRTHSIRPHFDPEIHACTAGREAANGDRCSWFAGTGGKYYVLLCDGMGTGLGAAEESKTAADLLRRMLTAGYPAEYALRSLNSLCALRSHAGAVTIDLAELCLDTGRANIYKWGAAPSWLLRGGTIQKIGTAGPPPGLSVTEDRETAERLSLRRGETLVLLSDGAGGEDFQHRAMEWAAQPPGELAAAILAGSGSRGDDATAAVIRLNQLPMST